MKIRYEESMPFGHEYLSKLGSAEPFPVGNLDAALLADTERLAVRSTTKVNAALLQHAPVLKQVVTATAGTNHLDIPLLEQRGITWGSAAGCNAVAVAEYVLSILLNAHCDNKLDLANAKVGIVGAGNVGTRLSAILDALHISYVLCDPPLQASGDTRAFVAFDDILRCDVITLHVPYVAEGQFCTDKLLDERALSALKPNQLLINACRGEVIDEVALKARLKQPDAPTVALDVFDNEPNIDTELLDLIWFATPHIAGHTVEGKVRGTQMVYDQMCAAMGKTPLLTLDDFLDPTPVLYFPSNPVENQGFDYRIISNLLFSIYDIKDDDRIFRQGMAESVSFSKMRKEYRVRREIAAYQVEITHELPTEITTALEKLGIQLNKAAKSR